MSLENTVLNERSQTQKPYPFIKNAPCKPIETESRLMDARDWREEIKVTGVEYGAAF
jgi:hypothetical protein